MAEAAGYIDLHHVAELDGKLATCEKLGVEAYGNTAGYAIGKSIGVSEDAVNELFELSFEQHKNDSYTLSECVSFAIELADITNNL